MPSGCKWLGVLSVALFGCGGGPYIPVDAGVDMLPCSALAPLASRAPLGPWKTRYAYYAQDRSFVLLQVRGTTDSLIRIDFPSGKVTTVAEAIGTVKPLGRNFLLLGVGDGGDDVSVYDGNQVRKLYSGSCSFSPTPDGTRLYVDGLCTGADSGLGVIDVATGTASIVAKHSVTGSVEISPRGQWVAYQSGDSSVKNRTIVVADAAGSSYTIASAEDVSELEFATDDLLVYQTSRPVDSPGDMRGHVPGSGDTSFLIAADRNPGYGFPCSGHRFSPDRTRVLGVEWVAKSGSQFVNSIYSVPLRGGDQILLVDNWSVPYSVVNPFAFDSLGKYAVYVSISGYESTTQGSLPTYDVSVVDMHGSKPRKLSNDAQFKVTTTTSSVLLVDTIADGRYRLRLTNLDSGVDQLSYLSKAQVYSPIALQSDQAVLFTERDGATVRSRFLSTRHPQSVVLGEWDDPDYRGSSPMPVTADPTGCFTVVNIDKPSSGTRLVLLPE